jgi:AcrR family transcriptional regulator
MEQKYAGKEDLRVRRTRKMLQNALMEATIQRGFESVTVQDICDRAMVNRATFYRHYADKYDLIDQFMKEIYDMLDQAQNDTNADSPSAPAGLIRLLEHLHNHAHFYRAMLGPKGYAHFGERIRQYIEKRFQRSLPQDRFQSLPGRPPVSMLLRSLSNASLGAIEWWLEEDMPVSPEQMAVWSVQLGRAFFQDAF